MGKDGRKNGLGAFKHVGIMPSKSWRKQMLRLEEVEEKLRLLKPYIPITSNSAIFNPGPGGTMKP